jgi:hypothetical protein
MSSGGSAPLTARPIYSTGATGTAPEPSAPLTARPIYSTGATGVAPEPSAPYAQSAPAPSGGKGGYNPNPYSQQQPQQPQVYMPPSQPTFYDQAFMQPRQPQVRSYGLGGMGGGNAYARRYRSYSSPIEARPPPSEMVYAMPMPYPEEPRYAVGPTPGMPYPEEPRVGSAIGQRLPALPANFFDPPSQREYSRQAPVEATQPIVSEPNYGGGIGSLYSGGFGNNVPRLPPGI